MLDTQIKPHKAALITEAVTKLKIESIVDLGACWAVNGGYSFHALETGNITRSVIVDGNITDLTKLRAEKYDNVKLIEGMLGDRSVIERVGEIDAIIMFDILLHQVKPDWNEFLSLWSQKSDCLIIYNQNWEKTKNTVRFIDRGLEWYKQNVYFSNEENTDKWFGEHDIYDERQGKLKKDIYNFWQWGITTQDMINTISNLGFKLKAFYEYGSFNANFPWIVKEGFIFTKKWS